MLVPVDIKECKLNNTLLLPDSDGAKTGVLICLDSETPYYRIRQGSDLPASLVSVMPYNADKEQSQIYPHLIGATTRRINNPSAIGILNYIRAGRVDFGQHFNSDNPQVMDIASISAQLANTIDADYKLQGKTITNKLLLSRGIAGAHIPADASLQANYDNGYQSLSAEMKKHTYMYAIGLTLHKIENDNNLPPEIKARANIARMGGEILVPFDIGGHKLNNTILLPDSDGSKTGILICLDAEMPYYHIRQMSELPTSLASVMPYNANEIKRRNILLGGNVTPIITPGANMILDYVRTGNGGFERYINHTNPSPIAISALSAQLVNHIEEDYKIKRAAITNKILMSRAIDGANILGEGFHLVDEIYKSDITTQGALLELVFNHRLRKLLFGIVDNNPAEIREAGIEYLRAIERPFATLSRDMQSIISSYRGETVQEANRHIHEAEYIGSWVDVTVGAVASLTPVGFAINILQSAAGLGADVLEGKELDSMAIANLVIGCIPEGKLAAKIGKFSRIGGRAVKYGLMVGNKTFDLAIVGESIKTAVKTGDPLAIYQALLASGMSIRSSYHMAKNMSLKLNITRSMEESASLEQLQKIHSNAPESMLASSMTERKFRLGSTELLGRINSGELEISSNNGVDWERGSKLHLLAYRLQNAGGKNKLPAGGGSNVPEGGEAAAFTENSHPAEHLTIVRSAHDFELNVSDENKYFLLVDTYEDGPMESGLFYANKVQKIPLDNIYTLGDAPVYSDFDIAFGTGISGVKSLRSTPGELSNLTRKDHLEIMGHGHPGSITQYDGTRLNGTQLADKLSEHGLKEIGFIRIVSCNITNKSDVFLTDLVRRLTELNIKVGYVSGTRHYVSQTDNIRGHRIDKVSGPVPVDEQFRYVKGNLIVDENLRSAEDTPSQEVLSEHPVRKVIPARKYEPHTPGYQANYSIDLTDVKNLRTRLKLNMRKNVSRIQRFNEKTNSYEKVNDYEVVPYHTTDLDVNTQLRDMLSTYESLNWIASDYTGSGSMDLRSNLKMGYELLCEISGDLREPSPSASKSHFLLIEKTAGPVTYDNILGIGKIVDLLPGNQPGEKSAIIIESVVAHPYTIITKNSDFIRYAASRGYQLSQEAMARYNIKHVGTQLIRDGLKQTMQKIDKEVQDNFRLSRPESIQFSARNPITARMAEKFGARRSDASNISNELMRVRAVGQSDIGLHEEPNIISFDGPRPTSRTRIRLKEPSSFLGPDSSISFVGDNKGGKLVIQAHGAMANVNHLSAKELAIYLKGHTAAMGIDMKRVNTIILRSCYSANGGMWSTAQILANLTGKKVKAYYGVVTSQMTHNTPAAGKIFIPNKLGHRLTNAERGHNLLHRTSEILLRIRSSLRRVPRSTNVSEMQAIIPPRLNDNYRAFLVDTLHLIEGRSNPASFSQKYGINAGKLIKLMSRIDARTGLDDEEFISSFYKLFKPGKVRSNGTVRPDSVLLEKLIENSNPSFMQFHLNRFNAVERSTNSRGEIHQGQKVLIDYSFNVKKMPDSSWVGLYRHNDLPGVDDPIVWKHLDRAGGGVDIDTSSLDKDRYRVMFFYDDSYNTLEHQVSFSIV
ncbi:hypothetical protein [Aeromonas sp. SG16]|uniref:hypothetical protein n=1 Tax=Aeromonas sp. SG16 TaxID=2950548 RepID=UPI00210E7763|nr:hypothetical protein [Aeromonas sp. SG16]MCQ4056388.1 hypothetical protein [Aeromonas sp. SG16]